MLDPKFNEIPVDAEGDILIRQELTPEQREEYLRRQRAGLSINDTVAADANRSIGGRGVNASRTESGAGAGAGMTQLTPGGETARADIDDSTADKTIDNI